MASAVASLGIDLERGRLSRPLVPLVAAGALLGLCWLLASGANPLVVLGAAAFPLVVALGYRYSFALLAAALVVRPLVDGMGVFELTAGIGVGLIGLAVLMSIHDVRALVLMVGVTVPVTVATAIGLGRWGDVAVEEGLRILSIAAVAAITLATPTPITRTKAARVVQVAGLIPAVVALVQGATGTGTIIGSVVRATGTLAQANPAAHFFGLCALASLVLVVERSSTRRFDLAAVVLFGLAVMVTGSLGGIVSFVVMLLAYLVLAYGVFSIPVAAGLAILDVALVGLFISPLGQGRLAEFVAPSGPEVTDNSLTWRFKAWGKILEAWNSSPVLGQGLGATKEGGILESNIAHNEYLYVMAEMGVIGVLLITAAIVAYVVWILRFRRLGASRYNSALAGALLAGLAIDAAIDNPVHFSPSMFVTAFLLAAVWRVSSDERAAAHSLDLREGIGHAR